MPVSGSCSASSCKLARALFDLGFETLLRIARGGARHRELLRHRIECDGQRVELADAAAGDDARVLAARQSVGGGASAGAPAARC